MKYDFSQFYNFGHYGIFEEEDALYPEVRGMLKEALVSDEDFNTGWGSFKKRNRIHSCSSNWRYNHCLRKRING